MRERNMNDLPRRITIHGIMCQSWGWNRLLNPDDKSEGCSSRSRIVRGATA